MSGPPPDSEQHREQLQRLLHSNVLKGSPALRSLLVYLGQKSLAGQAEALKEYTIGVEAFGRSEDYDPQQDSYVRVQTSKLRQKIEEYYRTEGAGDPIGIDVPKGQFGIRFRPRTTPPDASAEMQARAAVRRWRWAALFLAAALAATALLGGHWRKGLSAKQRETAWMLQEWAPELEQIWQPYVAGDRPVLIVMGTPLFTMYSRGYFRDPMVTEWEEAQGSDQLMRLKDTLKSPYAHPAFNFTGIGEATGAFLLCRLLMPRKPDLLLKRSSGFSWEDAESTNVIFLGPPKFNPRLKDIPVEQELVIVHGSVRNPRPLQGEAERYPQSWTPDHSTLLEDHALISRLPGLHGRGFITMLGAGSTEGTWAAVSYVTLPQHAAELTRKLRDASGRLPDYFQVVVRAKFKDQVPIHLQYVTHRVLKPPNQLSSSGSW